MNYKTLLNTLGPLLIWKLMKHLFQHKSPKLMTWFPLVLMSSNMTLNTMSNAQLKTLNGVVLQTKKFRFLLSLALSLLHQILYLLKELLLILSIFKLTKYVIQCGASSTRRNLVTQMTFFLMVVSLKSFRLIRKYLQSYLMLRLKETLLI